MKQLFWENPSFQPKLIHQLTPRKQSLVINLPLKEKTVCLVEKLSFKAQLKQTIRVSWYRSPTAPQGQKRRKATIQ
jgi:hypothetical protein